MSPLISARYKEVKDWLFILSPIGSALYVVFQFGIYYQDFKQNTNKWNGYGDDITTLNTLLTSHESKDDRIHAEIYAEAAWIRKDLVDTKKDFNDKLFFMRTK